MLVGCLGDTILFIPSRGSEAGQVTVLGPGELVRWPYLVLVGCSVIIPEIRACPAEGGFVTLPGPGGG